MIRLTYWSSTIPNRLTYLTYHTCHPHNTNHSCIHFIPTIHTKHTIHSKHAIPDRPYTPYIPNNIPYHTPTTPQRGRDITMAGPWPWPRGGLERWTILLLYIYIYRVYISMSLYHVLGHLFRHCFAIFVPLFWEFLSLTDKKSQKIGTKFPKVRIKNPPKIRDTISPPS